jgi:hypothetical protein
MTSYPFIEQLFRNVLLKSKAIQGRFYVCPRFGFEINSETLDQALTETLTNVEQANKYPLVLMMPPRSRADVKWNTQEFEPYRIQTFWLKTTNYGTGTNFNPNTQTSLHTIPQDWHDMKRAAENFIRVLDRMQRTKGATLLTLFRLNPDEKLFNPVSLVGTNRASGV